MQNKSFLYYITQAFNWLMIKITKPKTKLVSATDDLHKKFPVLRGVPRWKALKRIDQIIADSINTYHQPTYKGESLYSITNAWTLSTALNVIKYNIAKESDFVTTDEPCTAIKHFKREIFGYDRMIYNRFFNNPVYEDLARKNSNTRDEYFDLMFDFSGYLYQLEKYNTTNRMIKYTITDYSIDEYLGNKLHQINDEKLLEEAIDAIEIMREMLDKGVLLYDKQALENLTLFLLKKARIEYNKNDFSNITFDEVVRSKFLHAEKLQLKREKKNEHARECREKIKGQQKPAKKAVKQQLKSKPISKAVKPVKKVTAKKGGAK